MLPPGAEKLFAAAARVVQVKSDEATWLSFFGARCFEKPNTAAQLLPS